MATVDVCIKSDLHEELKELRDYLGLKSFSDLFKFLKDYYLKAPAGVPPEIFDQKREKYLASYPDEFMEATRMCLGVTVPEEFDAVFEETIRNLIKKVETTPDEFMILQCSHCNHVWDYKGKHNKISNIHCPTCGATASKKWLREIKPLEVSEN